MTRIYFLKSILITTLLTGYGFFSKAQVDPLLDNLRSVVPPSPNASALAKFSEWPVSAFTGVPEINIPIYELKGRSISVPISINYHAAGIRVGETASWVGLGWALNAGGCISRTVQGLPDEYGYLATASNFTNANNFCTGAINSTNQQDMVLSAAQGETDTQGDIYNMSAMGKSYRIYINAANDSAYTMPASNVKIISNFLQNPNPSNNSSSWTILLEDGTKLIFGSTSNANYMELTTNSTMGIGQYVSAWYLQSITTATGETITFTYTTSTITQPTHFSQSDNITYNTSQLDPYGNSSEFTNSHSTSTLTSNSSVVQLNLTTIESDLTRVYFLPSTSSRQDLSGGVALNEIKVLSKLNNQYVEDWLFNFAYSQAATGNELPSGLNGVNDSYNQYRLKLMGLTRNPSDGSRPQVWSFSYNSLSLPSQTSFAQDYWGFYNGATSNISLLPPIPFNNSNCTIFPSNYTGPFPNGQAPSLFTGTGFMPSNHDIGNNRSPNEFYMQAEMLNKITYPTGGYSIFNYEGNKQPANREFFSKTSNSYSMNLSSGSNPFNDTITVPFTLTVPQYVYLSLSSTISSGLLNDFPQANVWVQILDNNGNGVGGVSANGTAWANVYLPGNYTFRFLSNCTQSDFSGSSNTLTAFATFSFNQSLGFQNTNQLLGGVRINNTQQFDGVSATPINSMYYTYGSPTIINPVDTINDFLTSQNNIATGSDAFTTYTTKLTRNASSKFSMGAIQGGTVGYQQVTTSYGLNGADGYTISYFSPAIPASTASRKFPYPPNDPFSWIGGLLTGEQTYNASGKIIKSAYNSYSFFPAFELYNIKCGYATTYTAQNPDQTKVYSGITQTCFSVTNQQVQHSSSTKVDYNVVTGDSLSETTNYYYDDNLNMQPIRTIRFNSRGDSVVTYQRTALELSSINASIPLTTTAIAAIDTMVSRNMVSQPVESEKYVRSILDSKALLNYKVESNGFVEQDNLMIQNASNPIETRLQLTRYDTKGNLREQLKTNDAKHNYIYDYKYTYPIADITNADSVNIAYTSFEADGSGYWTIPSASRDSFNAITGTMSYNLSSGAISKTGLTSGTVYLITYWSRSGSYSITGGSVSTRAGRSVNGWTYFEHTVTASSTTISITGTGDIDELRLFPQGAMMTTYTYSPLVGQTSMADPNSEITYYEYDGLQRLKNVKDYQGNIIKNYQYNYGNSCGTNCSVLPLQTMSGTNTISYPVGVFNVNGKLLGNATTQAQYITLWMADTADSHTGTIVAGLDSMHFNFTLNTGRLIPHALTGLRYYHLICHIL